MSSKLFSADRHEPLTAQVWDEAKARRAIKLIVDDTEARFSPEHLWPTHPNDSADPASSYMLYWGAAGVFWALRYLEARGACTLQRDYGAYLTGLLAPNQLMMQHEGSEPFSSYLMGDTSIQLLRHWDTPSEEISAELVRLIEGTLDHPARELMWGSPGTLLAAFFLHEQSADAVWGELYRATARKLWDQLQWSDTHGCHYWTQDMYGRTFTFLDAVHGFVATAAVLIKGRLLLDPQDWAQWEAAIATTVQQTAEYGEVGASWRAQLEGKPLTESPGLMQFCHGAPGFVICLADFPTTALDRVLLAAGEATWAAGPLRKGSNLCHGTGGNGYAFLKLYRRFGDQNWLDRARAFAMHGIAQTEHDLTKFGHLRYSLWTGDLGFAVYLLDCIEGTDQFPTLDVYFA